MKKKLDSLGGEQIEVERGDESGTGPDLLDDILASLYLLGEYDLAAANAKADAEMREHRDWLLSKEPIQYLDIIVKGRDGVQVKGPVHLTRFSGTVDPKYADGDIEIVRLDANGERRNVLLRCPLRGLGPQGITLHRKYQRIRQTLTVKITPNELGGFNLDVVVQSEALGTDAGGGSPASNGGGKRTRAARAGATGTGGGYDASPLAHATAAAATPSRANTTPALRYALMAVLTITVGLCISHFAADLICSPPPASTARVAPAVSSGDPAPAPELSRERQDTQVIGASWRPDRVANAGLRPEADEPDMGQKSTPPAARGADERKEARRREQFSSVRRIVIVITPWDETPEEISNMEKITTNLQQSGFTEDVAQKKPNVLVMSKPNDAQATKTVFIRIADGAGEKDDCAKQVKAAEQEALLLVSEILSADIPADKTTAALSNPTRQCVEREARTKSDGATD